MVLYTKQLNNRINEVDFFRGIAIIFMIIYHIFALYDVMSNNKTSKQPFIDIMGSSARYTFIFLMGMSIGLSSQKYENQQFRQRVLKRSGMLLLYAAILSVMSFVFKDRYIRFGILHYMSVAMFILAFTAYYPTASFVLGLAMLYVYTKIYNVPSSYNLKQDNYILSSFGYMANHNAIDHFPLTRWLWVSCSGLLASKYLYENGLSKYGSLHLEDNEISNSIIIIGKYSLEIYMAHWPILYGLIKIFINLKTN